MNGIAQSKAKSGLQSPGIRGRLLAVGLGIAVLLSAPVCFEGLEPDATGFNQGGCAFAKKSRAKTRSAARSSRSSKKTKIAKGSSKKSRSSRTQASRSSRSHKVARGKHGRHHHVEHVVAKPPPKPTAAELEVIHRRDESYSLMSRAYKLYDQGIKARLAANYGEAVEKLNEAWKLFNDARGYQRTGESSLIEAFVHFELGQSAEAMGDVLTARDSYVRCLNIRPSLVDASIHLVNMLAQNGQWPLALAKAQESARANPSDPRAHLLLALALSKTGHAEEAQSENEKAKLLFKAVPHYKPAGIDFRFKKMMQESGGKIEPPDDNAQPEGEKKGSEGDLLNVMGDEEEEKDEDGEEAHPESKEQK